MQHLNNLVELYQWSCQRHADREILGTKKAGTWQWLTYRQFRNLVEDVRGGLASLGVQAGDRVAFIGDNSVEWAVAAYASYGLGAAFVPMYQSQRPSEWQFILADSGARVVFCTNEATYDVLERDVIEFIDALGISVYEGYGLTETSPVVTTNWPGARKFGSVGKVIPGVRVVIDKSVTSDPRHGEIVVYGPNIMRGYHNRPEENAAALKPDGGLRTGDLGYFDDDGYLFISGRSTATGSPVTSAWVATGHEAGEWNASIDERRDLAEIDERDELLEVRVVLPRREDHEPLTASIGARVHFHVGKASLHPGLSYTRGLGATDHGPMMITNRTNAVTFDLPVLF